MDHTFTSFVDHTVQLQPVEPPADELGFVVADDGAVGGLAATPTDNHQGYYRLEVVSPNTITSEVASYNVTTCRAPISNRISAG